MAMMQDEPVPIPDEPIDSRAETLGPRMNADAAEQHEELAAFRREVSEGIRRISGTGGVHDIHVGE